MKRCDLCGTCHESYQAHVFATNTTATNGNATNREDQRGRVAGQQAVGRPAAALDEDRAKGEVGGKTANRRQRVAYNAYQREYMRKKRAK